MLGVTLIPYTPSIHHTTQGWHTEPLLGHSQQHQEHLIDSCDLRDTKNNFLVAVDHLSHPTPVTQLSVSSATSLHLWWPPSICFSISCLHPKAFYPLTKEISFPQFQWEYCRSVSKFMVIFFSHKSAIMTNFHSPN